MLVLEVMVLLLAGVTLRKRKLHHREKSWQKTRFPRSIHGEPESGHIFSWARVMKEASTPTIGTLGIYFDEDNRRESSTSAFLQSNCLSTSLLS